MATTTNPTQEHVEPVRLLGAGRRRWRWVGLGVTLVTVGALSTTWVVGQADQREGVVVAARDLAMGHTLTSEDVHVVEIAGVEELAAISSQDMPRVLGQTVTVPVGEGMPLAEAALVESDAYPPDGQAVVGAALEPTQYPASLRPGAYVSVIAATSGEQTPEAVENPDGGGLAGPVGARVQSITTDEAGVARVELLVSTTEAAGVAQAAAAGELVLAQTQGGGS